MFQNLLYLCNAFERKSNKENTFGEMAEWSIAAVLKTVELRGSWGSNPYLSAELTGQNWSSKGQNPTNQWFVGFFVSTKSIPKDTKRTVKDKVLSPIRYHSELSQKW